MIKSNHNKNISSTIHRIMALVLLLCFVALGVKAQQSWWPQGAHATGIDNGVVYLNDLEDHNWTYYSGVDVGNYNTDFAGKLYSPNPRNVKITYKGRDTEDNKTSNVKVSIDAGEDQNTFVYYKTLEEGSTAGEYPYTVISNPFSVRPSVENTDGTKTYYGFNGWKIIDGGEYIKGYNDTDVLPLDAEIIFVNLPYDIEGYPVNCISANIELQATWTPAQVTYLASVITDNKLYIFNVANSTVPSTTYENNFLVINKNYSGAITVSSPCTIMMVEPDGSANYRDKTDNIDNTFKGSIVPFDNTQKDAESNNVVGNTKIEYAHWKPSASINASGRNFTIGRGMVMGGTKRTLYGSNTDGAVVNQILKIESGIYSSFLHYGKSDNSSASSSGVPGSIVKQWVTFGCDYDRARADKNKLVIQGEMLVGRYVNLPTSSDKEICRVYSLSGNFMSTTTVSTGTTGDSYYLRVRGTANVGHVYMEILGGNWKGIAGGWGDTHAPSTPAFTFRMRGGLLEGSLYGAAEYYDAAGTRTYVITDGTIKGWVAGGANGTRSDGGEMDGASFIYVGGNTQINSGGSSKVINRAVGGNVFGAGCGYSATSSSGQVTLGTNVVIADNAYVERGVYGGGSYGYCNIDQTSNIYITGGTIGGKAGGVNSTSYNANIQGGVYGGACQNKGGHVNIFMTGGTVNGGIYGGSNASGTLSGSVNMTIAGGTVGTQDKTASVYGGGYGNKTTVSGNVNIKYTGGVLEGNLFGGGNEGAVTGNTNVTITGGEVKQNVYGGGNKAAVSGTTNVVIGQ